MQINQVVPQPLIPRMGSLALTKIKENCGAVYKADSGFCLQIMWYRCISTFLDCGSLTHQIQHLLKNNILMRAGDCCWPMNRKLSSLLFSQFVFEDYLLSFLVCAKQLQMTWVYLSFLVLSLPHNGSFALQFTAVVDHRVFCYLQGFCFSA